MGGLSDKERILKLIESVLKVAKGDFSVQNELSGNNDEIDALAMGLNMMIDDLKYNVDLQNQNERMKTINEELRIAKEKAQESDRLKTAFLANMSHEIRSPMNAIMGFASLMARTGTSPHKFKEYYNYIKNSGEQLLALVDDIIDISKIESNQLNINIERCNVNNLLHQVLEIEKLDKKLVFKHDLRLISNFADNSDNYLIETDPIRFKQIFINLLVNAVKFTEKGSVEIGYTIKKKQGTERIQIYVKDTGRGIKDEYQKIIFDRFTQVHFDSFQTGAGLGLSITKGLVELLGGNISFHSKIGKGTTFFVDFPVFSNVQPKNNTIINNEVKRQYSDLSGYTIYIAEDIQESVIYLKEIIDPLGIKSKVAENGQKLIELIERKIPDLVLLDIHMPVMNGYDTIKEIRRRNYKFPVVAQTAYAMHDELDKIMKAGCNGYLIKPLNEEEVVREIIKHLKK